MLGLVVIWRKRTNTVLIMTGRSTGKFGELSYASLFKLARQQWPDAPLSAFSRWEPINTGIIENTINVHMESKPDPELTEAIVDYIHERPDFKLMFIQLDHPTARATSTDSVPISGCYRLPLRIST